MDISGKVEALLFFRGEPVSRRELGKALGAKEREVEQGLAELREKLAGRGVALVENGDEVELRTAPEASELIEKIRKEELSRDLGKAGAETLAIVLYRGPSTRAEIDYIRGVNSTFILRNLMIRGLAERVPNPSDARSFVYKPTIDLLASLGVKNSSALPDYAAVRKELEAFAASQETSAAESETEERAHGEI